ncbi:hypothetical protein [Streptomyces xanthii]|uniref:Uncharacterized protein n=1 Tax=Streptomyces xanthii TaxID=2768069 RepID=A0A7H1B433_9ACTN|nr:hypothetical protein [Streptomyces xanthii]QNS03488.1 hypothetical protein IAG42_07465 [Streptomyces xanthii]
MPRPTLDDAALLRISSCCADVMITAGDTSAPVAELAESFTDRPEASIHRLMRLTFQDLGLRRVWREAAHETARLIRPAVEEPTGTPVDSLATTLAAGQAVTAAITVLEHLVSEERALGDLVDETVRALHGTAAAQDLSAQGHVRGKLVLDVTAGGLLVLPVSTGRGTAGACRRAR